MRNTCCSANTECSSAVERTCAVEVVPERLLEDDARRGLGESGCAERGRPSGRRRTAAPTGRTAAAGRRRARSRARSTRGDERAEVVGRRHRVGHARRRNVCELVARRRRVGELRERVADVVAEARLVELHRRRADDPEAARASSPTWLQAEQPREQLALGQVAGRAEEHDDVVVGHQRCWAGSRRGHRVLFRGRGGFGVRRSRARHDRSDTATAVGATTSLPHRCSRSVRAWISRRRRRWRRRPRRRWSRTA